MRKFLLALAVGAALAGVLVWRSLGVAAIDPIAPAEPQLPAPATSPGTEQPAPTAPFVEVTAESGVDFVHDAGARGEFWLPETIGAGGALCDHDADGDLDLFLVQGGPLPGGDPGVTCRLYSGDGHGRFADVTTAAGAGVQGYGLGCAAADYDGDGDVDLYVTRLGANVMLANRGDGTFADVTAGSGLGDAGFSTAATFLDFDRDGTLDLYVVNYVDWSPDIERECPDRRGDRDYCIPLSYGKPAQDRLYRGLGDGKFADVTAATGIEGTRGNGLGVHATDLSGDGWVDLYVANDQTPGLLWVNQRDGTFVEAAAARGCALDVRGMAIAGMGVASADLDGDLDFDLLVTNIGFYPHLALEQTADVFVNRSEAWGIRRWGIQHTGFGIALFDQDNDGRLDGLVANGAVARLLYPYRADLDLAEPDQFLRQDAAGLAASDELAAIPGFGKETCQGSRAVLVGDIDNDGDLDAVVTSNRGPTRVYRNENRSGGAWLLLDLRLQDARTHALGARVIAAAGGHRQVRELRPQQGYLSSQDPRIHFGFGAATSVDSLEVRWPDGSEEFWLQVPLDHCVRLVQGSSPATTVLR